MRCSTVIIFSQAGKWHKIRRLLFFLPTFLLRKKFLLNPVRTRWTPEPEPVNLNLRCRSKVRKFLHRTWGSGSGFGKIWRFARRTEPRHHWSQTTWLIAFSLRFYSVTSRFTVLKSFDSEATDAAPIELLDNLPEVTEAIKPILGEYYNYDSRWVFTYSQASCKRLSIFSLEAHY